MDGGALAALFSLVKMDGDGLSYRQNETYAAVEDIYVTEPGFQEGRTNLPPIAAEGDVDVAVTPDPDRLSNLTTLYAELVSSDPVRNILLRDGPVDGTVVAEQFTFNGGKGGLPILRVTTTGPTAASAMDLARRQTAAFREYIALQQEKAGIRERDRVVVNVLRGATTASLAEGRSFVVPGVAFIALLAVFVGLAFVLYNLRSRRLPDPSDGWRAPD